MFSPQALIRGIVARARPLVPVPDGPETERVIRLGTFGDVKVESAWQTKHLLADEGVYFSAHPPIGTAVALAAAAALTSYVSTTPIFALFNTDKTIGNGGTGKSIYLDFIKLLQGGGGGTVPASSTSVQWAAVLDTGNRLPSANFAKLTPSNVNGNSGNPSITTLYYCNANSGLTVPAAVNAVETDRGIFGGQAPIIAQDISLVYFGGVDIAGAWGGLTAARAVATGKFVDNGTPFIIGPQQWGLFYIWSPAAATTAWTYEFSLGLVEK